VDDQKLEIRDDEGTVREVTLKDVYSRMFEVAYSLAGEPLARRYYSAVKRALQEIGGNWLYRVRMMQEYGVAFDDHRMPSIPRDWQKGIDALTETLPETVEEGQDAVRALATSEGIEIVGDGKLLTDPWVIRGILY